MFTESVHLFAIKLVEKSPRLQATFRETSQSGNASLHLSSEKSPDLMAATRPARTPDTSQVLVCSGGPRMGEMPKVQPADGRGFMAARLPGKSQSSGFAEHGDANQAGAGK